MIITGDGGEIYLGFDGGVVSAGKCGPMVFQLPQPGEYVIPASTLKDFYATTVSASGCFSGSFQFEPLPVPDERGWIPRKTLDR